MDAISIRSELASRHKTVSSISRKHCPEKPAPLRVKLSNVINRNIRDAKCARIIAQELGRKVSEVFPEYDCAACRQSARARWGDGVKSAPAFIVLSTTAKALSRCADVLQRTAAGIWTPYRAIKSVGIAIQSLVNRGRRRLLLYRWIARHKTPVLRPTLKSPRGGWYPVDIEHGIYRRDTSVCSLARKLGFKPCLLRAAIWSFVDDNGCVRLRQKGSSAVPPVSYHPEVWRKYIEEPRRLISAFIGAPPHEIFGHNWDGHSSHQRSRCRA